MAGERTLPGLGLTAYWNLGSNGWKTGMDANLRLLSALVQARVLDTVDTAPGSPTDGDIYLSDDDWGGGTSGDIMLRDDGAWVPITPEEGWLVYDLTAESSFRFDGTDWVPEASGSTGNIVINKATSGDDAVIEFQTGASPRVRIGTLGDDLFTLELSTDGSSWVVLFVFDGTNGTQTVRNFDLHNLGGGANVRQYRWTNNNTASAAIIGKSRGSAVGDYTIVQDGDRLGQFTIQGSDGVGWNACGAFRVYVEGTPGVDNIPGMFAIGTVPVGAQFIVDHFFVHEDGTVTIGTSTKDGAKFFVDGSIKTGIVDLATLAGISASDNGDGAALYVTDAPGGACFYVSDGTDWVQHPRGVFYKTVSTDTYSMIDADFVGNVHILCTHASGCTITIPSGLVGTEPCIVEAMDADPVEFVASGTTLNSLGGLLEIAGQYGQATVQPRGSNVFHIAGALV